MPTVSVLIPAPRADFLEACIASVITQTYDDFELCVGDDIGDGSGGDAVAAIVSKWDDPRIRYSPTPAGFDVAAERARLLRLAAGRYVKILSGDDILFPDALAKLVEAAGTTGAALVFSNHCFFDPAGQLTGVAEVVAKDRIEPVSDSLIYRHLIGKMTNFVGPLSNVLFDLEALRRLDGAFAIDGLALRFHEAVAAYANCAYAGYRIAGTGYVGTAIRRHSAELHLDASKPYFSTSWFEWELLLRWTMQQHQLTQPDYIEAMQKLFAAYQGPAAGFPEMRLFLMLRGSPGPDGFLGEAFREVMRLAYFSIDLRRASAP